jgi:signal transduction histidine kinase
VKLFGRIDPSGKFVFGVADTGIGIAIEDQARVFESFGQGRHDAIRAEKGTGLGLSIVKGLAEAHDGRVYLESEVGKGTCIALHLPPHRIVRDARANKAA